MAEALPQTTFHAPPQAHIVSIRVDATSYADAASRVVRWALLGESRYVCVASVANVMLAHDFEDFREIMQAADLVTPDGMPLVWALRWFGIRGARRVYGPDLSLALLRSAEAARLPVALYGGTGESLAKLQHRIRQEHPELPLVYAWSPPFRALTAEEDRQVTAEINASGARLLLVGIGAPKQERWMAAHRGRIDAVMVGVGAAFDFLSGTKAQAPLWMRSSGLEWLFRLASEPRRLWRRYLSQNPRFVCLLAGALLRRLLASEEP